MNTVAAPSVAASFMATYSGEYARSGYQTGNRGGMSGAALAMPARPSTLPSSRKLEYSAIGEEARAAEEAEERRLFYVAMTRARERLVLSGAAKLEGWSEGNTKVGGGPIAWIAPAFVPDLGAVVAEGGEH